MGVIGNLGGVPLHASVHASQWGTRSPNRQELMEEDPLQAPSGTIGRIAAYVILCALFICVALASGPIVRTAERLAGVPHDPPAASAWFERPGLIDNGVPPGSSFGIVVAPSVTGPILISSSCGDIESTRSLLGAGGHPTTARLVAPLSCGHHWISVRISGIRRPLRAWVR